MKAVTRSGAGGPDVLSLGEAPDPVPGDGEVLIAVVAAGVNRADLLQRQGNYPPPKGASELLGLEVSGTIAGVGFGVDHWSVGDPCVALLAGGGYAELVAVPAGQVVAPPRGVDLVTAAGLIEVSATVVSNFDATSVRRGETVLVHGGAGGIGSFAIQYAHSIGARVIATAGSTDKVTYCLELGADAAMSYREDWVGEVSRLTENHGVDVILDVMGASYLEPNVASLAVGGRLIVIGLQGGRKGTLDLGRLMTIRGSVLSTTLRSRPVAEKSAICCRVTEVVWPLIGSGAIRPAPQTAFPLAEVAAAHRRLESGDNIGKVVLTV
ncbi:NAD(P)H-quinone oxidoreductase [Microlunatus ginsengisoli]|uniref:NAD(P)H-quinone oxidoreductase n=1 Tax=Microlunatus ginsengisoli TaxID=363863 RepID=A0ABP7AP57_9ACTN